jgi:DNA-directed RNA polymerase alpha subunit
MAAPNFTIRSGETDEHLEFELQGVAVSTANAIRRVALSDVEIYAVNPKNIQLHENTTPLHNEYVSHRISLLPINQNIDGLETLQFYLSKKKTKNMAIENDQNGIMDITTDDVQVYDSVTDTWIDGGDIFIDTFLITKLNVKQKLLGEFTVSKGTAKEHSRWQAVSTIAYRYKVLKDEEHIAYDKLSLEEERMWKDKDTKDPDAFIFYLETAGIMKPRDVIKKCLEIIRSKLTDFKTYVQDNRAKLGWTNNSMLDFEYEGEMHTLGNLLATNGLEQLGKDDFIGYRIIHPMMNKFIIRMKLAESNSKDEHIERLIGICENLEGVFDNLIHSWMSL